MTPGLSQNGPRAYFGISFMRYAREHRASLALVLEANRFFLTGEVRLNLTSERD